MKIPLENYKAKFYRLEKELNDKKRELRIEASLDKVRKSVLAMKQPADMIKVCRIISNQLKIFGVINIRNIQTVIPNEQKSTYLNYQYFTPYNKSIIEETEYTKYPRAFELAKKFKKSAKPFFNQSFHGKSLDTFRKYRKDDKQFPDPLLNKSSSVHFYFYSIGTVALGISAYNTPLSKEDLKLLHRFRNVFELAYRRFVDIEKAIAQAREAKIEACLERVRARAMAMQNSYDLVDTSTVLFHQLKILDIDSIRTGIATMDEVNETVEVWSTSGMAENFEKKILGVVPANVHPLFIGIYNSWKNKEPYFSYELKGNKLIKYYKALSSYLSYPEQKKYNEREMIYTFFFPEGSLNVVSPNPLTEEQCDVLIRFAKVFGLVYTRFLDLKRVEAQAREAKIEASLEKVRAAAMSMHKPDDLLNICETLYRELVSLGFSEIRNSMINIHNDVKESFLNYDYSDEIGKSITPLFYNTHPVIEKQIKQARSANDAFSEAVFKDRDLEEWKEFRKQSGEKDDPRINNTTGLYYYFYSIGNGTIGISTFSPINEEKLSLLKRFRNVFSLAYQRYSDIALAEAQTREAEIQLALERVRARSMAMHKSDELLEVIKIVSQELLHLGFKFNNVSFGINSDSYDFDFWVAAPNLYHPFRIHLPYFDSPVFNRLKNAQLSGQSFFVDSFNPAETKEWMCHLLTHNEIPELDLKTKKYLLSRTGFVRSAVLLKNIFLFLINYDGILYSVEENNIIKRFAEAFDQAYVRFLDLQKAEVQAREAKIEASLERVRAVAMSMHKSDDLLSICEELFKEFQRLGFNYLRNALIHIQNDEKGYFLDYDFSDFTGGYITKIFYKSHPIVEDYLKQIKSAEDAFAEIIIDYDQLNDWRDFRIKSGQRDDPRLNDVSALYYYGYSIGVGDIAISTFKPIDDSQIQILKRFRNVFDLAYRRYNDIAQAEAQARETQVQLALERVRARAMAMHSSNDLSDTMGVLFTELPRLGISSLRCGVVLLSKNSRRGVFYAAATTSESDSFTMIGAGDMNEHPVFMKQYECWLKNENYITTLSGEELHSYYKALFARLSILYTPREHSVQTEQGYYFPFSEGMFYAWSEESYSEESINLLNRFKAIIDLTFRRYLDLQKAEAQAREAQIEAGLERVRTRTMAMYRSEELAEVVAHLFEQLDNLNIKTYRCNLGIVDESSGNIQYWATTNEGKIRPLAANIPIELNTHTKKMYNGWKEQENIVTIKLLGEERLAWTESVSKYISFTEYQPENIDKRKIFHEPAILANFYFKQGFFAIHTLEELDSSSQNIINRFAKVFEQTYTRFLDLLKAEAQAKEAKIEASLEKVRARAMSMHTPDDLSETVSLFFKELRSLNVLPWRCGVGRIDEETRTTYLTTTSTTKYGDSTEVAGKLKQTGHPVLDGIFDNWKLQKEYYPVLRGDDINKYYSIIKPQIAYPEYPLDAVQYGHFIFFNEGFVFAWTENRLSDDELQIFRRFSSVLSLTYRRYMDLKEAEARAVESVRQAALDRVRAEIASMRTSEDLNRITPIIWRELKTLDVPFIRCGVFIVDDRNEKVQVYLTTPDGKSLGVLHLSPDSNELTSNIVEHWRKKQVYKEHWDKEDFISWTKSMIEIGQVQNAQTYQGSSDPPESLDLHFVPFAQGMLYVGDVTPLTDDKLELVRTLAEAFSIAYARYEDFKNLEEAKNKVEVTLNELKSAQAQLIHSEKMASLGELTAGIAHEIKNPLNFVNNFSEVSRDLLDEMKAELQNKNIDEVIEIVEDLRHNLEKINYHGKRADSIVKGMLLHSRGTSGEKVLTNINDLLDQYVNLAYHGIRAQNKEINVTIEREYDESLEKIKVVPQDISRVFLNIINNACYAANEKRKRGDNNFSPTLKVSTKNINGKVEIRIRDNGDGIPRGVREQIFKPFFTTKPTGEGTGLGLSISYDIVTKVHGGDIKIESEEGNGAEFIIILPIL